MSPSITTPMSAKTMIEEAAAAGSLAGLGGCAFSSAEQIPPALAFAGTLMSREAHRRSHGAGGGVQELRPWVFSRDPVSLGLMRTKAVLKASTTPLGPTRPRSACSSATTTLKVTLRGCGAPRVGISRGIGDF